ncbi:type II secretion system protein N [Undibacterium sp. SXout7W]|uniref:type II secretion system protein N n=1 Tax=Undibacterium sp. SXout7W TaxID=3413049 RepID=UPI003BEF9075
MKRLPILLSVLTFILLCMSLSFWGLHLFKPAARAVSMPAIQQPEPSAGGWGALFGNAQAVQVASNYQLQGVVLAKRSDESLAIISTNGKPANAIAINRSIASGVVLKEVHEQYVLISEAGVIRRVELPAVVAGNMIKVNAPGDGRIAPQIAPVAFPAHQAAPVPSGSPVPPAPPMVTPGLPAASLPATITGTPS